LADPTIHIRGTKLSDAIKIVPRKWLPVGAVGASNFSRAASSSCRVALFVLLLGSATLLIRSFAKARFDEHRIQSEEPSPTWRFRLHSHVLREIRTSSRSIKQLEESAQRALPGAKSSVMVNLPAAGPAGELFRSEIASRPITKTRPKIISIQISDCYSATTLRTIGHCASPRAGTLVLRQDQVGAVALHKMKLWRR